MSFKELNIKEEYNSITDDVYNDFFNKVLKQSKLYFRIGSIFTSKNFAACAEGLQDFIQKDGTMELIMLPYFENKDINAINQGMQMDMIIANNWLSDFNEIKDKFVEDHYKALAWMLANNYLQIKLAVPTDLNGNVIPVNDIEQLSIFKKKIGIFWDENDNAITFNGNIDFDDKVLGEYYFFRVYRNWDESEEKFASNDFNEFQKYWNGEIKIPNYNIRIISLPKAISDNILASAPKSKSEIKLSRPPRLRPYQQDAVQNWLSNNGRGIFEMATGTGKTFTAIGAMRELSKKHEKLFVVIVCPYDNLERQWSRELEKWNYSSMITSGNVRWRQSLSDLIAIWQSNDTTVEIVITSYATFYSQRFTDTINKCPYPVLLIADEVHNAGAPGYVRGLIDKYSYRLGLSATIERYFDEIGTAKIREFFGETAYSFTLKDAIEKEFLVEYYYYPVYVDLTEEEFIDYRILTAEIARILNAKEVDREKLEIKLRKRSLIIRDAENKMKAFEELIIKNPDIKYTLIYCSEKQMNEVKDKLNGVKPKPIINRQITANDPKDPEQRSEILQNLADGKYSAIVANRVLDEGVDVPEVKNCIILASTGNPKQFIQRRGRVLRKFSGQYPDHSKKDFATIYDFLIIPELVEDYTDEEIKTEKSIVRSQIHRQETMAKIAKNSEECMDEIKNKKMQFGLA